MKETTKTSITIISLVAAVAAEMITGIYIKRKIENQIVNDTVDQINEVLEKEFGPNTKIIVKKNQK